MDDIVVPSFYVVNRTLPKEQAFMVIHALSITPVQCAIISDPLDCNLAIELSPSVVRAATDKDALALAALLAEDSKRPVLVVGEADFLDAVYKDGKREAIAKTC
jgi:hypothetical protein